MVMRLALVVDQTPPLCWAWCHAVWATLGRKRLLWERIRAWCDDDARVSMRPRREALLSGLQKFPRSWRRLPLPLAHASLWDDLPSPQGLIPASGARDASRVS